MADDPALNEQLEYYRARAAEYDQWWYRQGRYDRGAELNAQWFSESAEVFSAFDKFQPSGHVLELACGTGIWSEKLVPFASSLVVVDGSREVIEIAKRRLRSSSVRYVEANIFEWEPSEAFDTVFFSFWLSHVPPERFTEFWSLVSRCLAPRGRVFFVDSRHEPSSTAVDHRLPGTEALTLRRRLNDGREFQIYKIFYDPAELETRLSALDWTITVSKTERYFIYGQGRRKGACG
jgi:demethylmenaquinone methyltransferase/2-methoxy-6-polyprenyl-1,4-benzoquinol methylase